MNSAVERFELRITIDPTDIDPLGHVNNVVYLRWVQDTAVAHWLAAAPAADQAKLLWVVIRHEIDYKQPAFLGDEIIACTWVGGATRLTFERHTEVLRASDRSVLARARTIWCPIDPQTGRPTRVSAVNMRPYWVSRTLREQCPTVLADRISIPLIGLPDALHACWVVFCYSALLRSNFRMQNYPTSAAGCPL